MRAISLRGLRRITFVCVALAFAGGAAIHKLRAANAGKADLASQARSELARNEQDEAFIRTMLGPSSGAKPKSLGEAYAATMVYVREAAHANLVQVQSVSIANRQIDVKGMSLEHLSERVAIGTEMRRVRIQLKGRYQSLEGLMRYLDAFPLQQGVVKGLEVVQDAFIVDLLVVGV